MKNEAEQSRKIGEGRAREKEKDTYTKLSTKEQEKRRL